MKTRSPSEQIPDITLEVEIVETGNCQVCGAKRGLFRTVSPCICHDYPNRGITQEQVVLIQKDGRVLCWLSTPEMRAVGGQPMCPDRILCFECLMEAEDNIEKNVAKAFGKETL